MRKLFFVLTYEEDGISTDVEVHLGEGIPPGCTDAEVQDAIQRAICEGYLMAKKELEVMRKVLTP